MIVFTDASGNCLTLHDVCYVLNSQACIFSLMKFRQEHIASFHFMKNTDFFTMTAANGFQITGQAIDDILHAHLSSQTEIYALTLQSTFHIFNKRKHHEAFESSDIPEVLSVTSHKVDSDNEIKHM